MTIKLDQLLMVLGGTLLAIGLVLGFMPVSSEGTSCGTAFTGASDDAYVADLGSTLVGSAGVTDVVGSCSDALSGRRAPALALAVPGALLAVVGFGRDRDAKARETSRA